MKDIISYISRSIFSNTLHDMAYQTIRRINVAPNSHVAQAQMSFVGAIIATEAFGHDNPMADLAIFGAAGFNIFNFLEALKLSWDFNFGSDL